MLQPECNDGGKRSSLSRRATTNFSRFFRLIFQDLSRDSRGLPRLQWCITSALIALYVCLASSSASAASSCPEVVPPNLKCGVKVSAYNVCLPGKDTDSLDELAYAIAEQSISCFTATGYTCGSRNFYEVNSPYDPHNRSPVVAPFSCVNPSTGVQFSGSFYWECGRIYPCPTGYSYGYLGNSFACFRNDPNLQTCPSISEPPEPQKDLGCGGNLVGHPCNAATGNKYLPESHYKAGNGVPPLDLHYNSQLIGLEPWGFGWTSRYHRHLTVSNITAIIRVPHEDGRSELFVNTGGAWRGDADTRFSLSAGSNGYALTSRDGSQEQFDTTQNITSQTNLSGQTTTYQYDSVGRLAVVSGPFGHALVFGYGEGGHVTSVTPPDGVAIGFDYDTTGRLTRVRYADGSGKIYHYENGGCPKFCVNGFWFNI
jgi:YD repeat-containing protein